MTEQSQGSMLQKWQRIARRIRVPLGFVAALLYLEQLAVHRPAWVPIAWSLALVLPGLALRGYAAGYVKKNQELTTTGPYAHVRNPLYLGSILMASGFAVALMSWPFAVVLAAFFLLIYVPVIASEEAFLRETFLEFEWYCARVPRLIPRITPVRRPDGEGGGGGGFSFALYRKHREYNSAVGAVLLYSGVLVAMWLHSFLGVVESARNRMTISRSTANRGHDDLRRLAGSGGDRVSGFPQGLEPGRFDWLDRHDLSRAMLQGVRLSTQFP